MKTNFLYSLLCLSLLFGLGCEGCEQTPDSDICPDEIRGDFFIAIDRIESAEPFICNSADFPDFNTWQNDDIFTDNATEIGKYYITIRIDGFCDNIGKTEPFSILRKGVDNTSVVPTVVNGRHGFRINDLPIDRQLTLDMRMREPCHDLACNFCPNTTGNPNARYRIRFLGLKLFPKVEHLDITPLTIFGMEELCDCEM